MAPTGNDTPATLADEKRVLTRRSGFNLVGLGISAVTQFGLVLVLAHWLHQRQVGVYFEAFAAVKLLSVVATLGLDVTAVRYVSMYRAQGEKSVAARAVRHSVKLAGAASVALALLTIVAAGPAARLFGADGLTYVLRIMALGLPFVVLETVLIGATRGTGRMRAYVYVDQILDGLLRLCLTLLVLLLGYAVAGAGAASTLTSIVTFLAALFCARRVLRVRDDGAPILDTRRLLRFSAFQWGTVLAGTGTLWADTLLLGIWRRPGDVAAYSVATRTVALGLMFVLPIGIAFQPVIGRLHTIGNLPRLARMYSFATRLATLVGCPPLLLVAVLASPILTVLYGASYATAAAPLAILAVAQMVNAATGPSGYVVTMIGRTDVTFRINVIVLAVNLILNVILIPPYGMVGAGVAWAAAVVLSNSLRLLQVWRNLHIQPFDRATVRVLVAIAVFAAASAAADAAATREQLNAVAQIALVSTFGIAVLTLLLAIFHLIPRPGRLIHLVTNPGTEG